jgi:hypothetical protein
MLIQDDRWKVVREQFSEEEKIELRQAVTGETICPRGFYIDETKLNPQLNAKVAKVLR